MIINENKLSFTGGEMREGSITIRKATGNDVPQMVDLLNELFSIESDFIPSPEKQSRGLNLLLSRSGSSCIIACEGERVVGMITYNLY